MFRHKIVSKTLCSFFPITSINKGIQSIFEHSYVNHVSYSTKSFRPPSTLPSRRVVVTGLGLVTPLATGVDATWQKLCNGECGVGTLTAQHLTSASIDVCAAEELLTQIPCRVVASVDKCHVDYLSESDSESESGKSRQQIAPFVQFALIAASHALKDANWLPHSPADRERTGVAIGGGIGSMRDIVDASSLILNNKVRRLSPFFIPRILINMAAGHVSINYGFMGPNHSTVTACASGAHSIGDAYRMIQNGDADVMVAGGAESSIDALSMASFCRLRALSCNFNHDPSKSSRPFDRDRDGFVMGEGAGIVVLEDLEHARKRGVNKIYAEIRGYGLSGDAFHITQPAKDARGAFLAMRNAIRQSNLECEDIEYINAHATSTPIGDAIEALAIKNLFFPNQAITNSNSFAMSSTKGAIGHLLGASGAVESIFTILAVHKNQVPPTLNLENVDDSIFDSNFYPTSQCLSREISCALTNSFGFGGTNASLLFTKPNL